MMDTDVQTRTLLVLMVSVPLMLTPLASQQSAAVDNHGPVASAGGNVIADNQSHHLRSD